MSDTFLTPEAVEDAFYRAFASTDLGAMARVWDPDDARCIHPGGDLLIGTAAVLESWRRIFAGAAAPTVRHRLLHQAGADALSIRLVEERIGPSGADDAGLTRLLSTNVYRRTATGWRMVLHHATLPLVEQLPDAPARGAPDRLH
jgi:ketosteroid isomerase-like protein